MDKETEEQLRSTDIPQANQPLHTTSNASEGNVLSKKLITVSGILLGFLLFGIAGYSLGIQKQSKENVENINTVSPTGTQSPAIIQSPTGEPLVSEKPLTTPKIISVPSTWKKYTSDDQEFGIRTTMAMPDGFSFRFTGSESIIQNDLDTSEVWDYSTSVYADNNGVLKNHYTGGSRREWYKKRLSEKQSTDKILSVREKPLNSSSYLEMTVQTPNYDERGAPNGTKTGNHYVYVQNGIVHMIIPSSNSAYTPEARIPTYIEPILASLTSVLTK